MKAEEQTFEKKLLYTKDNVIEQQLKMYDDFLVVANELVNECEKLLKRDLTDEEKTNIIKIGVATVKEEVKNKFPFPEAPDEFNLQAMGVNFEQLDEVRRKLNIYKKMDFEFNINKGVVISTVKTRNNIRKSNEVFTENQKQNEAMEIGKELENVLGKLLEKGFVSKHSVKKLDMLVPFVRNKFDNEKGFTRPQLQPSNIVYVK